MSKKRLFYIIMTVLLLAIEVIIALFVHDRIIRPYVGDILVVIVVYTFARIFLVEKVRQLPLWVFIFAASVEILQYFKLVERLGLSGNRFLRVLIGSTYDINDIICYGIGCIILGLYEFYLYKKLSEK